MIKVKAKSTFHGARWGNVACGQVILIDEKDAAFLAANGLIELETKDDSERQPVTTSKATDTTDSGASKPKRAKRTTKN